MKRGGKTSEIETPVASVLTTAMTVALGTLEDLVTASGYAPARIKAANPALYTALSKTSLGVI